MFALWSAHVVSKGKPSVVIDILTGKYPGLHAPDGAEGLEGAVVGEIEQNNGLGYE